MPQISIVQKGDLAGALRIDAEYYKKEYLDNDKILESHNVKNLIDISESIINFGAYALWSQIHYLDNGVPFLQVQNIHDNCIAGNFKYIDAEVSKNILHKSLVKEGQVLLTIAGTIGNAVVAQDLPKNTNSNQAIANITLQDEYNPFYISTFLNSKYGKYQSKRLVISNVQPNLLLVQVKSIKIPIFSQQFQEHIEKLVKQAHKELQESKQLYKQAEQLLLEELDLVDYEPKHSLWFEVNKREVNRAGRYDAEYFQPKYSEIIEKIEEYKGGFDVLENIVSWKKGIEVGSGAYTDGDKQFVRVSDFSIFGIEDTAKNISTELFQKLKGDFQPKKGEILFTKDGTIGISSVIREEIEGIVSVAFLRLNLKTKYKNFERECLSLILNSIVCKLQAEQLSGGAIIEHLKPDDFGKIKIPLIQPDIQNKIADNITQSHRLREHSKQLLGTAKHAVETAIEKGEGAGAKYVVDNYEKKTKNVAKNKK